MTQSVSRSSIVPIFPLPETVFFPGTTLPLHIFEDRYVEMVRDAAAGEGLIAMTLLRSGWERDEQGSPSVHQVGTVGRIEKLVSIPGGRFDIRLVGLQRVRFREVQTDTPYRVAHVDPLPEIDVDEDDPAVVRAKLDLVASHGYLLREISGDLQPSIVFDERVGFAGAVNRLCAALPVEAEVRQELLETDDLLVRKREVSRISQQILEFLLRLKTTDSAAEHLLN